jgi:tripeptidyl-peptidase II
VTLIRWSPLAWILALAACAGASAPVPPAPQRAPSGAAAAPIAPADQSRMTPPQPVVPAAAAYLAGLMPLKSTGVDRFAAAHPTYDGRGVLIGVLDTGIDPAVAGLIVTSAGAPKVLDLRDFSGEGRIALTPVTPNADGTVVVVGRILSGTGRIARLAVGGRWYGGVLRELPLGPVPAADLNGDGDNTDVFPLVVVRATDGWVVFIDTNLNGSFEDEMPLHDYREGRQTIALGSKPVTLAANLGDQGGVPVLDLIGDTGGHGTHVAGIAAGHNLYNVAGFNGVAPGAQLLGLKIANNARGGISTNGSMIHALEYAARFAAERGLPLVLTMSFGVGNEHVGRAEVDSLVDAFLRAHPDVVFTVSAGNDGPGLETAGFPGSADLVLSIGSLLPGSIARMTAPDQPQSPDVMGDWTSRGGDLAKPDILTPGAAYSSVPRWDTGHEIKTGTSMSAPYAAGLVARLLSGMVQEHRHANAADLMAALRSTAVPLRGWTALDDGAGVPRLESAYRWLAAAHQGGRYVVRTTAGTSGAFRRDGLAGPGDTTTIFHVRHVDGFRVARVELRTDATWIGIPNTLVDDPRGTDLTVTYHAAALVAPGVYTGTVIASAPNDTLAGPLFTLSNTVIVPYDLSHRPLLDSGRRVGAGRVQRYFLRVPSPDATLSIAVRGIDAAQQASVHLYEPTGRPFRDGGEVLMSDGTLLVGFVVRAEDEVAGVYELDVTAPPLATTTVDVRAALGSTTLVGTDEGIEISNPTAGTVTGTAAFRLLGAERDVQVTGRGLPAESLAIEIPAWASRAEVDVTMPRQQWNRFTDFGVTVFDSAGQLVNAGPLNYAVGRQSFAITPAQRRSPVTIELFPALAMTEHPAPWHATVSVRFLLDSATALGAEHPLTVVSGGRTNVAAGPLGAGALALPDGFHPLVDARVAAPGTPDAERRVLVSQP